MQRGRKILLPSVFFLLRLFGLPKRFHDSFNPFTCSNRPSHSLFPGDFPFPGIDPDQGALQRFAKVPDSRDRLSGTNFQDDRTGNGSKPAPKKENLFARSFSEPFSVPEHQDVRPGGPLAKRACGQGRKKTACGQVDFRAKGIGTPDFRPASVHALEKMERAVTLHDPVFRKSGFLKLAVHVAGKDEKTF